MSALDQLMDQQHSGQSRYYGKYRGTVVNNVDPMQIGRIQVIVPDVSNLVPTSWAMLLLIPVHAVVALRYAG